MNKIITIGREAGSAGHTIGKMVADRLGIPCYDRELIDEAAKKSGLSPEFIESNEQKTAGNLLHNLASGASYTFGMMPNVGGQVQSLSEQLYNAQKAVITEFADKGSCVIVGRCADHILADRDNVLKVFIYADMENRIQRGIEVYGMTEAQAIKEIKRYDKDRDHHYNVFTDEIWGDRHNYDLMINSKIGFENCAKLICTAAEAE